MSERSERTGVRLGYGLVTGQRVDGSTQSWKEVLDDALDLAVAAEGAGFDTVWVSEHHFTDDGYLSALLPALAALAARTERVKLGTNVLLAPLHHPLRLAEDAAFVDVLSGGRLLLGLAIGYRDEEFAALGVAKSERVARLLEAMEVCRAAWTGEPFDHAGIEGLVCRPAPATPPPIWLGGWIDAAVRRAGRFGDGYLSPVGGLEDTRRRVELLDRPGMPIGTATYVVCTDDGSIPPSVLAGLAHLLDRYRRWYGSSSDAGGGRDVAAAIERGGDGAGMVVGTPEHVLDQLAPLAAAFPDREHELCVRLHYPGMPRAEAEDHIARFAEGVLPALRS